MNGVSWDYYNKFEELTERYMPARGEGETKASQIVTAVNKLIYKWYNDGDVFDNTRYLNGWCNDLSSYANWLDENTKASRILHGIFGCHSDEEYEELLKDLADTLLDEKYLAENETKKVGTIYKCEGAFEFVEQNDNDDDYEW
jgi:hypothetical protein